MRAEPHRTGVKEVLAGLGSHQPASGASLLIYHRVGGGTTNELDVEPAAFARQLRMLAEHDVVPLDTALDRLDAGDASPSFVLTFDDGFEDVYENAWPLLRRTAMPFTLYLTTAYPGRDMVWEGATATGPAGRGIAWDHLREMVDSGLCTVGNHTHTHVGPRDLTVEELDRCTSEILDRVGVRVAHHAYCWGIPVPELMRALRDRFRSAATGSVGRNLPDADRHLLTRIPVRRTDGDAFYAAKLTGRLLPEKVYAGLVRTAKSLGVRA